MKLIIGLGNPGVNYAKTRHNVGFMAVEVLARQYGFNPFSAFKKSRIAMGDIAGEKVILVQPQTFMNLSGSAVQEVGGYYKIAPQDTLVIQDDLALALGRIKIKQGGSAAGHNGIKDIDRHIGPDYWRIRIGIGKAEYVNTVDWVLGRLNDKEYQVIQERINALAQKLPLFWEKDPYVLAGILGEMEKPCQQSENKIT